MLTVGVFLWSVTHFYLNHRLLHVRWFYDHAHYLHHRNVNTGPWTGISMHPLEHLIYFSVFALWWAVPAHPFIVILGGLFQGVSPAVSHSGFERFEVGRREGRTAPGADYFHHLHHRYFECNYGNRPVPIDKLFGTFHDGTPEAHARHASAHEGPPRRPGRHPVLTPVAPEVACGTWTRCSATGPGWGLR